ncbi:MAG TPA: type II toxin-antitoxin system RelE/ParE family toxin [Stellaceae bacterium]|nr:type II toxin-antitoxin system RelE/ParE family toxin [Stellaceae bacterium]
MLGAQGTEEFVDFIAANPLAGDVVAGTGGVRKVRWARPGGGKRGGARVLYYDHDGDNPIGLLTIYGKGNKDSLTNEEKAEFRKLTAAIKQQIASKRRLTDSTHSLRDVSHDPPQHRQRGS